MTIIGWYVHHHGLGHLTRFLAIRPELAGDVVVFSSLARPPALPPRTEWVELPSDAEPTAGADGVLRDPRRADPTAGGRLHWAPLGHPGHRRRLAMIAEHADRLELGVVVVDVSVEVALFVRTLGVPVVVIGQPGDRTDAPHDLAYGVASLIVCPWPDGAYDPRPAERARGRVVHVGGVSRFGELVSRPDDDASTRSPAGGPRRILLLGQMATPGSPGEAIAELGSARPDIEWQSAGFVPGSRVDALWPELRAADVVVTAAGQNSIADVAASGRPAVVIPQERPFDEQVASARSLADLGLAATADAWPGARGLLGLIDAAVDLAPDWSRWHILGAAARAARAIEEVVA